MFRKDAADGFCMALADSVPGVSGGTVAFILGFYDQFIDSVHDVVFGKGRERLDGLKYLIRLMCGWAVGMGLAVLILNALFEQHIHFISSMFVGFLLGAIPVVIMEEKRAMKKWRRGIPFLIAGAVLVTAITWLNVQDVSHAMDLSAFSAGLALKLFFVGMAAISAMFLPGISGSTILLIFGAYMPIMNALKDLMHGNAACLPAILVFIVGIIAGASSVVKLIQRGLTYDRPQMIYFILGMMAASLYAVVMGPATLSVPAAPLDLSNFSWYACLIGVALIALMEMTKSGRIQKITAGIHA
ncbi:MAG: DUF368 domain-containing protein [Solobacterium sp.]|jgi:putative membrane protein|nr:DUF368 domain-containing protein [Solobacterium sp.]